MIKKILLQKKKKICIKLKSILVIWSGYSVLAMLTVVHIFKINFTDKSELQLDVLLTRVKWGYLPMTIIFSSENDPCNQ